MAGKAGYVRRSCVRVEDVEGDRLFRPFIRGLCVALGERLVADVRDDDRERRVKSATWRLRLFLGSHISQDWRTFEGNVRRICCDQGLGCLVDDSNT